MDFLGVSSAENPTRGKSMLFPKYCARDRVLPIAFIASARYLHVRAEKNYWRPHVIDRRRNNSVFSHHRGYDCRSFGSSRCCGLEAARYKPTKAAIDSTMLSARS